MLFFSNFLQYNIDTKFNKYRIKDKLTKKAKAPEMCNLGNNKQQYNFAPEERYFITLLKQLRIVPLLLRSQLTNGIN